VLVKSGTTGESAGQRVGDYEFLRLSVCRRAHYAQYSMGLTF